MTMQFVGKDCGKKVGVCEGDTVSDGVVEGDTDSEDVSDADCDPVEDVLGDPDAVTLSLGVSVCEGLTVPDRLAVIDMLGERVPLGVADGD